MAKSPRGQLILDAAKTLMERDGVYGDPRTNLACAGELKRVFLRYAISSSRHIGPAEHEAIDLLLTQVARIATGPVVHNSNYSNAVAYGALAGECALVGSNEAGSISTGTAKVTSAPFNLSEQELETQLAESIDERRLPVHEGFRPAISKDHADRGGSGN